MIGVLLFLGGATAGFILCSLIVVNSIPRVEQLGLDHYRLDFVEAEEEHLAGQVIIWCSPAAMGSIVRSVLGKTAPIDSIDVYRQDRDRGWFLSVTSRRSESWK